jgi:4-carboxymuconolactone decarboxylase
VNDEDRLRRGLRVRREVLGDDHVDAAERRTTELTADFHELISRYAWGEIWARPGLERETRRLLTIALLVAVGRDAELEMHLRAAVKAGVTPARIEETLLHTAIYCGVPAANSAFAIAQRVIETEGGSNEDE